MKKTCSIFVTALILYLSVINFNPASAQASEACSETNSVPLNQEIDKNYSKVNIEYTSQSNNKENNEVLEVFSHDTQQLYITREDIELMANWSLPKALVNHIKER